jgi:hypothetical protein
MYLVEWLMTMRPYRVAYLALKNEVAPFLVIV